MDMRPKAQKVTSNGYRRVFKEAMSVHFKVPLVIRHVTGELKQPSVRTAGTSRT